MREIKFRAWDKTNKVMHHSVNIYNGPQFFVMEDGLINPTLEVKTDSSEYYKAEIMQYTGLKDKNGKEIYEGDIVKDYGLYGVWAVGYNEQYAAFGVRDPLLGANSGFIRGLYPYHKKFEVIGNIYENKELLK